MNNYFGSLVALLMLKCMKKDHYSEPKNGWIYTITTEAH